MRVPIAKEGYSLIKIFLSLAIVFWILGYHKNFFYFVSVVFLLFFLFSAYFFRDPERKINENESIILSPADGEILEIEESLDTKTVKIFMSALNCHIQRSPINGIVKSIQYKKGKFHPAMKERASIENEQNTITIEGQRAESREQRADKERFTVHPVRSSIISAIPSEEKYFTVDSKTSNGVHGSRFTVSVKQVAGAFARRIVCNIKEGEKLKVGQRIGMIKFGSQVDISFPSEVELKVKKGDRVKAGITVVAKIKDV